MGGKKCETFGCSNKGKENFQVAPGTNCWCCGSCIERLRKEMGRIEKIDEEHSNAKTKT